MIFLPLYHKLQITNIIASINKKKKKTIINRNQLCILKIENLVAGKKGKKGKKGKQGTTIPLQNFWASTPDGKSVGSSEIAKVVPFASSWADEVEDEEYRAPQTYVLPTAPRASREFDDHNIPQNPPFLAYITNLPYDINRDDIEMFFEHLSIANIRLPEDGESGRLRGFGYIEFDKREDLIEAVSMPDPHIQNRRIRIDVSNEGDPNQKRMGRNNRGYDNYNSSGGGGADRDSTDWRSKDRPNRDDNDMNGGGRRGGGGGGGGGYGGYNRDRDRQRESSPDGGGNWRAGDRPKMDSPPPQRRGYQDREGYGGDRGGGDRGGRDRYGGGGGGGRRGGDDRSNDEPEVERPKLNLAPRTLPLPEVAVIPIDDETVDSQSTGDDKPPSASPEPTVDDEPPKPRPTPVPAANIFGSAKPVDTAAKEREIEERLERERQEKRAKDEAERERVAAEKLKEKEMLEEKSKKDDEQEAMTHNDDVKSDSENSSAPAVTAAAAVATVETEKPAAEANSWRRRTDEKTSDDNYKPRTQSPPRRRYSPARRNGM